jgi:hypothetical protein
MPAKATFLDHILDLLLVVTFPGLLSSNTATPITTDYNKIYQVVFFSFAFLMCINYPSSWYRRGAGIPHGRVVLPGFAFFIKFLNAQRLMHNALNTLSTLRRFCIELSALSVKHYTFRFFIIFSALCLITIITF